MNKRIATLWRFLTYDIWRITEDEVTRTTFSLYNVIKTIYLCINRFAKDRLANKASVLTYNTLLIIVPILTIVFVIVRGFGFGSLMEDQIVKGFGGPSETTEAIFQSVSSYLSQIKGGIFIGIGLAMLLWAVFSLTNNMKTTFSRIWQVKKAGSMYRKIIDYFSMLLLIPLLLVVSDGLSIFMSTMLKNVANFTLLAPVGKFLIRFTPFVLMWLTFAGLYVFMSNTGVKLKHALISEALAGMAHQAFRFLYISSRLWISHYNAIYGNFAVLPMFPLWLQVSWTICLLGAELTYAGQNIYNFSFNKDARNVSRYYHDSIFIFIMSLIAKCFEKNESPHTAEDISEECRTPICLANQVLCELQEINLLHEVVADAKSQDIAYQPSTDVNKLNVVLLLGKLNTHGSEDLEINKDKEFHGQWETLMKAREEYFRSASGVLSKDL